MTPPGRSVPGDPLTTAGTDASAFRAGTVFAGRYRMVALLRRSESGDVWQADDLVLQTPVALKIIGSARAEDRERILTEVRMSRQVAHPAIARVFDVGEAEGRAFCSMELVHGESLDDVVRRLGRLPSEKVRDIGEQVCEGLAAAHAHGLRHSNVNLQNVFIDADGLVHLTDVGIGARLDDTGFRPDVPAHRLAPELLSRNPTGNERSDIFAVGVLLYELLVGEPPADRLSRRSTLVKPSSLVPDVDADLERTILQALSHDPRRRPESAAVMAAQLGAAVPAGVRISGSLPPWVAGTAIAAIVILAIGAAAVLLPLRSSRPAAQPLTDHDAIVIADFANTTGEAVFDGTLKVALAVALEQSPFLKVVADQRIRDTLQLMERPADDPVTRGTAREIARREGAKAVVAGSIAKLGSNYVLALEALDADTGDAMAREQVEAESQEVVLGRLGEAATRLRAQLGESLALVRQFDKPLPEATTSSLEALHAYSLALDEGRVNPRPEAIPHLMRALEIDPNFAMAQALLSGVYMNMGRFAEAPVYARRAFDLRDRVSERERYFISWRYYLDATQAWDQALELAQSWTRTYPREAFAFNSLGLASGALGELERAAAAFREASRLDDRFVPPVPNLAGTLIALDRFDEARALVADARRRKIDTTGIRRAAYVLAFVAGDRSGMARELAGLRGTADAIWAPVFEGRAAAASGRFAAAHTLFQQGVEAALGAGLRDLAAQWTMEDAEADAVVGQCAEARREVARGLGIGRDNYTLERASRALALCSAGDQAETLATELATRFPDATLIERLQLPVTRALVMLGRGQPARALTLLEPVQPLDDAPAAEFWPAYVRGLANLRLKNDSAASAAFQAIAMRRGLAPTSPLYALAHLELGRAAAMRGDVEQARRGYERFLSLWSNADSGLAILQAARREYSRLQ